MKKAIALFATLILCFGLVACSGQNSSSETSKQESSTSAGEIGKVSIDNLNTSSMQVIDIRDEANYIGWETSDGKGGHIDGAIDFPRTWLDIDLDNESAIGTTMSNEIERRGLDLDKQTVLYTDQEVTDEDAKAFQKLGFKNLSVLEGGYDAYVKAGKKTDSLQNYDFYVYPQWVEDLVDGKNPNTYNGSDFKVVEVSLSTETEEYASGHIPGAINVNADNLAHVPGLRALADYENVPLDEQLKFWNKPSDSDIQTTLEGLGITKDTTVVLYGTTKATTAAARVGAILKYAGVTDIRILNGGKTLWKMQNRTLETQENKAKTVSFGATVPQNPSVFYNYEDELGVVDDNNAVVASIRSWDEYTCKISGYTYIGDAGDIAKSRFGYAGSDPYSMEDFRNVDNTMFNYNLIAERWNKWGITSDKRVSFHCGTGWRASETYFYACAMGWDDVHIYDGGWYEWSKHSDSPRKDAGVPSDAPEQQPQEYFVVNK